MLGGGRGGYPGGGGTGSPSGGSQATLVTGGGRDRRLSLWWPRSHLAMALGVQRAPEATTGWCALGSPQEQDLRPPAFSCLQAAQTQLQRETSGAGDPACPLKSLTGTGDAGGQHGEETGRGTGWTLCELAGTYTEKPKLARAGLEGVACTPTTAVVGGVAVWVQATAVGRGVVA